MNWKIVGRALVCLLLVCCLMINISPIRANALFSEIVALVSVREVVAAVLIGLGVMMAASAPLVFDEVVNRVSGSSALADYVDSEGKCKIIKFPDPNGGIGNWMVNALFVDIIRRVMFEEGVVEESEFGDGFAISTGETIPGLSGWDISKYPHGIIYSCTDGNYPGLYYRFSCFVRPLSHNHEGSYDVLNHSYKYAAYCRSDFVDGSWGGLSSHDAGNTYRALQLNDYYDLVWSNFDIYSFDGSIFFAASDPVSGEISSSLDISVGEIASPDTDFDTGYSTWASGKYWLPKADEVEPIPYLPLGLGQTYEETREYIQEQVQTGQGTFEITETDTGTDTEGSIVLDPDSVAGTKLNTFFSGLLDVLWTPFRWLGNMFLAGIETIFLPQEDFLTDKVAALRAEFAFADTLITGGQMIGDAFNGFDTEPPIIYIDLGATRGEYDIGGKVPFIDLTWYEEYKPTVDMLLSSLLWVVFIWKLFQKAPGIISGMPGDFVMDGLQHIGLDDRLPSRKAGYEVQRLSNRELIRKGRR